MSVSTLIAMPARAGKIGFIVAWGFCLLFCFGQHALRSAPGVMVPELTGTVCLASHGFSAACLATATGFAQMFGMPGGSARLSRGTAVVLSPR